MSRNAQRNRMALSNPRLAKPFFGSLISPSPSAHLRAFHSYFFQDDMQLLRS
jgi:hypothetical protein